MAANDNAGPPSRPKRKKAKRKKKAARKKAKSREPMFRELSPFELHRGAKSSHLKEILDFDLNDPNLAEKLEAEGWVVTRLDSEGRSRKKKRSKATKSHQNQRRRFARRKKKAGSAHAQADARIVGELVELSKVRRKKKT